MDAVSATLDCFQLGLKGARAYRIHFDFFYFYFYFSSKLAQGNGETIQAQGAWGGKPAAVPGAGNRCQEETTLDRCIRNDLPCFYRKQTKTNENEQKQTKMHGNEPKQTKINKNRQKQTKTNVNKRKQS